MAKQVLVIDDEPGLREALAEELADDFEVLQASSFAGALSVLQHAAGVSAVVSDLRLGSGPGGAELLGEVRRRLPNCARLIVSGSIGGSVTSDLLGAGIAHQCIAKPWNSGEILAAVQATIAVVAGLSRP